MKKEKGQGGGMEVGKRPRPRRHVETNTLWTCRMMYHGPCPTATAARCRGELESDIEVPRRRSAAFICGAEWWGKNVGKFGARRRCEGKGARRVRWIPGQKGRAALSATGKGGVAGQWQRQQQLRRGRGGREDGYRGQVRDCQGFESRGSAMRSRCGRGAVVRRRGRAGDGGMRSGMRASRGGGAVVVQRCVAGVWRVWSDLAQGGPARPGCGDAGAPRGAELGVEAWVQRLEGRGVRSSDQNRSKREISDRLGYQKCIGPRIRKEKHRMLNFDNFKGSPPLKWVPPACCAHAKPQSGVINIPQGASAWIPTLAVAEVAGREFFYPATLVLRPGRAVPPEPRGGPCPSFRAELIQTILASLSDFQGETWGFQDCSPLDLKLTFQPAI
ncbi:hypothetical protein B0H16DRAFT_1485067 [Mycena metata]|uniref:Uncharacterized protein n=1 Tax=Mycena metata TaxID=1033252 RepID=A0AAD7DNQ7_9AGAR|nr:hypothetical protein B0H16DRAFT_1485067 [Mycena metata]